MIHGCGMKPGPGGKSTPEEGRWQGTGDKDNIRQWGREDNQAGDT